MLGKIYCLQDSANLSIYHFKKVESTINNVHEPLLFNYQVLKWLASAYAKNGDSLIALRYFVESSEMGQRLNETNNISALNTYKFIRDEEINQHEKQKLELKHENEKHYFIIIIVVIIIVLVVLLFFFLVYRNINKTLEKQKIRLERALLNNSLLTKEMHHRVKNNLNMVSSLLSLQSKKLTNQDAINALKESQNRIKSVAILHQGLYQNMGDVSGKINLLDYISRLSDHISHIFKNEQKEISFNISVAKDITLSLDVAIPVGLILNEFITNSFKYAFNDVEKCNISIFVEYNHIENNCFLTYSDNGKGFTKTTNNDSFGFTLIDMLVLQLNATLQLDSQKGTKYMLVFKNA
jgi:two-component sensor histidine kinase